jgi:uncharacterized membrane protein
MIRYVALAAVAAAVGLANGSARAEDGFELCNRTALPVVYAKALNVSDKAKSKDDVIVSEGWFDLAPGQCANLWPGKLRYRYYLIYAEAKGSNRKWTGKWPICVDNDRTFKITGDKCATSRPHRLFDQVDTGDDDTFSYDLK